VPFDVTALLYKHIYEDFFGKDINAVSGKNLETLGEELKKKTLEKEKGKFTIQK
jgi:hypothetical protein